MKINCLYLVLLISVLFLPKSSSSQFDGNQNGTLSALPNAWQSIPASDVNCLINSNYAGLGDTPDLLDTLGPMNSTGISGKAFSGNSFVSGVRASNFHEGIM